MIQASKVPFWVAIKFSTRILWTSCHLLRDGSDTSDSTVALVMEELRFRLLPGCPVGTKPWPKTAASSPEGAGGSVSSVLMEWLSPSPVVRHAMGLLLRHYQALTMHIGRQTCCRRGLAAARALCACEHGGLPARTQVAAHALMARDENA